MTSVQRLLTVSLPVFLTGIGMLALGIMIMKCKPIVVSYKIIRAIILLMFAPILTMGIFGVVIKNLISGFETQVSVNLLFYLLVVMAICILLIGIISRGFLIYNVTESILIASLRETFRNNLIEYSQSDKTNKISKRIKLSQIELYLPELKSLVKIKTSIFGSAWVKFGAGSQIPDLDTLIADFRHTLAAQKCSVSLAIGIRYILTGVVLISLISFFELFQ